MLAAFAAMLILALPTGAKEAATDPSSALATTATLTCSPEDLAAAGIIGLDRDPDFAPGIGTYHYVFGWKIADVGKASVTVEKEGNVYKVKASGQSRKAIDRLYKMRYYGHAKVNADELTPVEATIHERKRSKERDMSMDFKENGEVESLVVKFKDGKEYKRNLLALGNGAFPLDPFTATLLGRSLKWESGTSQVFEVLTGKSGFLVKINCIGTTTIEQDDVTREVWQLVPCIKDLDDPEKDLKLGETSIYLTTDTRDVILIENKSKLGKIRVKLDRFVPEGEVDPKADVEEEEEEETPRRRGPPGKRH